jgi:hypothetical protein
MTNLGFVTILALLNLSGAELRARRSTHDGTMPPRGSSRKSRAPWPRCPPISSSATRGESLKQIRRPDTDRRTACAHGISGEGFEHSGKPAFWIEQGVRSPALHVAFVSATA